MIHGYLPTLLLIHQRKPYQWSKDMVDLTKDWNVFNDLDIYYIRQIAISLKDYDIQQKIDLEIKMREGTRKLLAACKREVPSLEAAKSLLTSHARVLTYMAELQRRKTEECLDKLSVDEDGRGHLKPCLAKVSISDIRIPLMWKNADHIMNKGDHNRYAVFCLLKVGTEIYDTELHMNIDRTACDVTFEEVFTFDKVKPDFNFILEVYSYNLHKDLTIASTPQKIRKRLNSIGSVKKTDNSILIPTVCAEEENTSVEAPKFFLVGRANLRLSDANDVIKIHSLSLEGSDEQHNRVPLFNHFCCRLAVQPQSVLQDAVTGHLLVKEKALGSPDVHQLWCRLRGGRLQCWNTPSEADCKGAILSVSLQKDSIVSKSALSEIGQFPFCITCPCGGKERRHLFSAESEGDLKRWKTALDQQIVNIEAWKQACNSVMPLRTPSAFKRRGSLRPRKGSLYDQLTVYSPLLDSPERQKSTDENNSPPSANLRPRLKHSLSVSASPPPHLQDPLVSLKETRV
ncbi:rhotekin-like isoform X4 [Apostichopus japonicus]|uniref:rhotekin-like isoform X4 n=1 Tax=Stichopus japonicus TaxID=307972 RepID=UPI003AB33943